MAGKAKNPKAAKDKAAKRDEDMEALRKKNAIHWCCRLRLSEAKKYTEVNGAVEVPGYPEGSSGTKHAVKNVHDYCILKAYAYSAYWKQRADNLHDPAKVAKKREKMLEKQAKLKKMMAELEVELGIEQ